METYVSITSKYISDDQVNIISVMIRLVNISVIIRLMIRLIISVMIRLIYQ